jgi:hypothetical protein
MKRSISDKYYDSECRHFDSDYSKKMSNNDMNTNSHLYLPVILETNAGITVKTWFLLDNGCTFRAISPQLVSFLNLNICKKNGIIRLVQNNKVVDRKGQTEQKLIINYGSKFVRSKFEVFNLFNDVQCVF